MIIVSYLNFRIVSKGAELLAHWDWGKDSLSVIEDLAAKDACS